MTALGTLALALAMTLTATPSASATAWQPRFEHYVALGDSYTSGPLIPLPKPTPPLGCARSTTNYPTVLAVQTRADTFHDVSCGGATTGHMTEPQHTPLGTNSPQLESLRPDTDLVTLGVGGNDEGVFGDIIGTCPKLRDENPSGSPCREHFTEAGTDTLAEAVARTGSRVAAVLEEITARSPHATVLVVGYPRIVPAPETGVTCPDVLPFADGDLAWADEIEMALNDALRTAAEHHGASFVDMYPASYGHDACAGLQAWIQGKDTNPLVAMSYHPNAAGMYGIATEIRRTLDAMS
ncbi:lysophospholipase L1-like esterase [Prauserella sediminis]|uniref:Lysophospholipase L1-like esterase n=2 Tax=Prauserella sediminis TaxID=577680 RepID=A0A839XM34_9PSEU|nr:lysophospholipase L1-like esterase [Prauserella sediminis]